MPGSDQELDTPDCRGRHWYQPRPKPRCRTDLWGFNSGWWMALASVFVVVLALSPVPWW